MSKNLFNQNGISGTLVAIIIAAILILAGGGYYMIIHRGSVPSSRTDNSTAPQTTTSTTPEEAVDNTPLTIQDVVGKGKNLECDFTLPSSGGTPSPFGVGKLYTTSSKGRSMMTGNTSGMSMEANAIYKDETAYSWVTVGSTTMGFKFDKEKMNEMSKDLTPQQKQQGEQFRAKMNFQCKPWTPDESKFVLPAGVEFK